MEKQDKIHRLLQTKLLQKQNLMINLLKLETKIPPQMEIVPKPLQQQITYLKMQIKVNLTHLKTQTHQTQIQLQGKL